MGRFGGMVRDGVIPFLRAIGRLNDFEGFSRGVFSTSRGQSLRVNHHAMMSAANRCVENLPPKMGRLSDPKKHASKRWLGGPRFNLMLAYERGSKPC